MITNLSIKNKKAYHDYEILEKYTAGIELLGTEIKSIRLGKVSLVDAYCVFEQNELYAKIHITEYDKGGYYNHDPKRQRKLLLTRRELNKLFKKVQTSGLTIIPLVLFINEKGFAKLEIALCRGKKSYDKRDTLKEKDSNREMDREYKKKL